LYDKIIPLQALPPALSEKRTEGKKKKEQRGPKPRRGELIKTKREGKKRERMRRSSSLYLAYPRTLPEGEKKAERSSLGDREERRGKKKRGKGRGGAR